jgi:thiol-disulfide isomerase/thioredoxin
MKRMRRIEIVAYSERTLTIKKPNFPALAWCPPCAAEARMITPDEAAAVADVNVRTIYRWVETARVHFMEVNSGALLICLDSLPVDAEAR